MVTLHTTVTGPFQPLDPANLRINLAYDSSIRAHGSMKS